MVSRPTECGKARQVLIESGGVVSEANGSRGWGVVSPQKCPHRRAVFPAVLSALADHLAPDRRGNIAAVEQRSRAAPQLPVFPMIGK